MYVVGPDEAGARLDVVVARAAAAPRSAVAAAVHAGRVRRNGLPAKGSTPVEAGDTIVYEVALAAPLDAQPQDIPIDIVFEDDDLIVVNKPVGMVAHPAHGSRDGTLVNALLAHVGALPGDQLRAGLVHRLDRDTSGLLLVAKTEAALGALGKAMQRRFIEREYLGLVAGIPEHERGTVEGAIGRDPRNRLRFAVRADGKAAVTHYEIRERLRGACEVTFRLETGRTHQIRVHMSALGHPIVGDPLYGRHDSRVSLTGQALHAWRLGFRHPTTREDLSFEVPPPAEYQRTRDALRG
jgi:23S rRNA pseudouridine1911/1915/1917 synthase